MPEWKERRFRVLAVDREMLKPILLRGRVPFWIEHTVPGLPADVEIVNVSFDPTCSGFVVVLWSAFFEIVPDMQVPPYIYNATQSVLPNPILAAEKLLHHIGHGHSSFPMHGDPPDARCDVCFAQENELRKALAPFKNMIRDQ